MRSRFNEVITERLLQAARKELRASGIPDAQVIVIEVPGAVEVPWALQLLAEEERYDFLVALGAVIRGETAHFDYVVKIATEGILKVMLDYRIPVGFGVLTLFDPSQAEKRIGIAENAVRAGLELALLKKERAPLPAAARTIHGTVVSGESRASALGFPTINIDYDDPSALPLSGIYAGILRYKGHDYPGAVSLGRTGTGPLKLEIHCFKTVPLTSNGEEVSCIIRARVSDFVKSGTVNIRKKIAEDVKKAKWFFAKF